MSVAFQTYTTATADYAGGTGNLSVNPPSGLTTNDLWVISTANDVSTSSSVGLASGFSPVSAAVRWTDSTGAWPEMRSQYKIAGASESAVTVPFTQPAWEVNAVSQRFSGVDTSTPIGNVSRGDTEGGSTPQTVTPSSVAVGSDGSAVLEVLCFTPNGNTGAASTPSSGYTEIVDLPGTSNQCSLMVAYLLRDAGTETPGSITATVSAGSLFNLVAQAIEIKSGNLPRAPVPTYDVSRRTLDAALAHAGLTSTELRNAAAWF